LSAFAAIAVDAFLEAQQPAEGVSEQAADLDVDFTDAVAAAGAVVDAVAFDAQQPFTFGQSFLSAVCVVAAVGSVCAEAAIAKPANATIKNSFFIFFYFF
jgi:hypothetical protein